MDLQIASGSLPSALLTHPVSAGHSELRAASAKWAQGGGGHCWGKGDICDTFSKKDTFFRKRVDNSPAGRGSVVGW